MNNDLIKAIIYLLTGISILLLGMRLMGNGLKKIAGKGLKNFFKKTQDSPLVSLGIGTSVTAVIQSSDATSTMVIGFINAGVMTIYQGLSIMLGGYIGTTVTGILASFSSLSISLYLLLFSFIGTILIFLKGEKINNIGEILLGLGMLFFGLAVMKDAFKNPDITQGCQTIFSNINYGAILFILGVLITAIIQSSSAVTSIVIAMVGGGALGLGSALYIALGATLGTVATTLLSCLGGNVNGKRTAVTAFLMRTITSVIMLIILLIFEDSITSFLHIFAVNGSDEFPIAMFTVLYNVIFMPLLIPFLKPLINLVSKLIKDKETDKMEKSIKYIDDKLLKTPFIAMMQVKKEIINMYELAEINYDYAFHKLINLDKVDDNQIEEIENTIDYLNIRITTFLIALSNKLPSDEERVAGSYFHVINDIERIGDHAYNFFEMAKEMKNDGIEFPQITKDEFILMNSIINKMFGIAKQVFEDSNPDNLTELHKLEDHTDDFKKIYYTNHYKRITAKEVSDELTPYVSSIITEIERVADHLTNIGYSIQNPTGDE